MQRREEKKNMQGEYMVGDDQRWVEKIVKKEMFGRWLKRRTEKEEEEISRIRI